MRVELLTDMGDLGNKGDRIEVEDVTTAEKMINDKLAKEVK